MTWLKLRGGRLIPFKTAHEYSAEGHAAALGRRITYELATGVRWTVDRAQSGTGRFWYVVHRLR